MYKIDENKNIIVEDSLTRYHSNKLTQTSNPSGQLAALQPLLEVLNIRLDSNLKWSIHHLNGMHNENTIENIAIIPFELHSAIHKQYNINLKDKTLTTFKTSELLKGKRTYTKQNYSKWLDYYALYKIIQTYKNKLDDIIKTIPKDDYKEENIPNMENWFKDEPKMPQVIKQLVDDTKTNYSFKEFSEEFINQSNFKNKCIYLKDYKQMIEKALNTHKVTFEGLLNMLIIDKRAKFNSQYHNSIELILSSIN